MTRPTLPSHVTDGAFLRACRREEPQHRPVWFMRQAGRSLPEYRALRADVGMLQSCRTPDLVTEITLQPVRRLGVDAAVLFSDIVVPVQAVGVDLDIVAGVGPVVAQPVKTLVDVAAIRALEPADVGFVDTAVRQLVAQLDVPLIGFSGAPFTLASYLVEGGPSKNHLRTKAMMYGAPDVWDALLSRLAQIAATFLTVQVEAGASAVQLFDSWAGALSEADYRRYVMPYSAQVLAQITPLTDALGVPRIHFGTGTAELLTAMGEAGATVVGVDSRLPLDEAARRVGPGRALQGNLDSALVATAPWAVVEAALDDVLARGAKAEGHVVNLGHGVLPETDPDVLKKVVDRVHAA